MFFDVTADKITDRISLNAQNHKEGSDNLEDKGEAKQHCGYILVYLLWSCSSWHLFGN